MIFTHLLTQLVSHLFNSLTHSLIVLTESKRQNDLEFYNILNKVRIGDFSDTELRDFFRDNLGNNEVDNGVSVAEVSQDSSHSSLIKASKLECINRDIDSENKRLLGELDSELMEYRQLKVSLVTHSLNYLLT